MECVEFKALLGKTISSIEGAVAGSENVTLTTEDGFVFEMKHLQDCCESVEINDVCGEVEWLIGSEILEAEEVTNIDEHPEGYVTYGDEESFTWTFYKFATAKGFVVIRWIGESNGYYSEGVDFIVVKEPS